MATMTSCRSRVPRLAEPRPRVPERRALGPVTRFTFGTSRFYVASGSYAGPGAAAVVQGAADLLDRDHAAQVPFGVDRREGAEPAQVDVAEQGLERRVGADAQRLLRARLEHIARPCESVRLGSGTASAAPRSIRPAKRWPRRRPGTRASGSAGSTRRGRARSSCRQGSRRARGPSRRRRGCRRCRPLNSSAAPRRGPTAEHPADQRKPDAAEDVAAEDQQDAESR